MADWPSRSQQGLMGRISERVYSVVFWSYDRGTFPYDIMCAAILLFIFLTPSSFFHDQPGLALSRTGHFGQEDVFYTRDERGNPVLAISTRLVPPSQDKTRLKHVAQTQLEKILNKPVVVADIKPIVSANGETIAYSVWLSTTGPNPF